MRRIILALFVLTLAVPSVFIFETREVTENASISGSFMENIRVVNKGAGGDRWTLEAQRVEIPNNGKTTRLSSVQISLPEQEMDVKSDAGIYDLESRNLSLTGNVEARTDYFVLKTDSIHFKSETGELTSPDRVVLTGNSFRIEGDGLYANSDKKVMLKSNVKAKFF